MKVVRDLTELIIAADVFDNDSNFCLSHVQAYIFRIFFFLFFKKSMKFFDGDQSLGSHLLERPLLSTESFVFSHMTSFETFKFSSTWDNFFELFLKGIVETSSWFKVGF